MYLVVWVKEWKHQTSKKVVQRKFNKNCGNDFNLALKVAKDKLNDSKTVWINEIENMNITKQWSISDIIKLFKEECIKK